jgi:hypothetical protein
MYKLITELFNKDGHTYDDRVKVLERSINSITYTGEWELVQIIGSEDEHYYKYMLVFKRVNDGHTNKT